MTIDRDRTDVGLSPILEEPMHECRDVWLGVEDHPRPYPTCRPHLSLAPSGGRWTVHRGDR